MQNQPSGRGIQSRLPLVYLDDNGDIILYSLMMLSQSNFHRCMYDRNGEFVVCWWLDWDLTAWLHPHQA